MSKRAIEILKNVDTVAGYTTYIDLVRPLIEGKSIISTAMKKEVDRVKSAIDIVAEGKNCALISSGDPGIYAMAGLAFEICKSRDLFIERLDTNNLNLDKKESIKIEVIPGIPALSSGGALLGSPLTHDFAVISLSDLLTPWDIIEKRIKLATEADFVIVFFNPKSKKRDWQLKKAQELILNYRDGKTLVGITISAMRDDQSVEITTLDQLHTATVNMQTTIFIGNSTSMEYLGFMFTPRGYSKKYFI